MGRWFHRFNSLVRLLLVIINYNLHFLVIVKCFFNRRFSLQRRLRLDYVIIALKFHFFYLVLKFVLLVIVTVQHAVEALDLCLLRFVVSIGFLYESNHGLVAPHVELVF